MSIVRDPDTFIGQKVNKDGAASVVAVTETELRNSAGNGLAYTWPSGTYSSANDDTILLVKNTTVLNLHIDKIWLSTDTDTRVVIHLPTVTVTTPAGTAVADVNLSTNFPNDADVAVAIRDETTNVQGSVLWSGEIMAAGVPFVVDFEEAVTLAKNRSIGVDYLLAATACDVTIIGHFSVD